MADATIKDNNISNFISDVQSSTTDVFCQSGSRYIYVFYHLTSCVNRQGDQVLSVYLPAADTMYHATRHVSAVQLVIIIKNKVLKASSLENPV